MAQLDVTRGDTKEWELRFLDSDQNPVSISGATVWWTVRGAIPVPPTEDVADAEAIVRGWWQHNGASVVSAGLTGPDGQSGGLFEAIDPSLGTMRVKLYPRLTTQLPASAPGGGAWHYDVQMSRSAEDVHTWDAGTLKVALDATRRTTVP